MSDLTQEQKQAACDYVRNNHCSSSLIEIECDEDGSSGDDKFSPGEDGVWVRGWLFCPKEHVPNYLTEGGEDPDD